MTDTLITTTVTETVLVHSTGEQITVPGPATHDIITVAQQGPPGSSTGTVYSVSLSAPTGFAVSGGPVTHSGTLALSFASGYSLPTNASQSQWATAYGWGNHANAGYLLPADIGVAVQGYSANLAAWAGVATSAKVDSSGGTASNLTLSGTVLNDGYTEEVFAISGTSPALSPNNGSIQTWTLTANSTPTLGTWANGQSMTLMIDDGTARTISWTILAVTWKTNTGLAPTLNTTGFTAIALWRVGNIIYGARVGDA